MEVLTKHYHSKFVRDLMNKFDRYNFCIHKRDAYIDKPSILFAKQTISAPHMHAKAIEYLEPVLKPGNKILDIGSGSGYLCACFGEAVKVYNKDIKKRGTVIGLEILSELVNYSHKTLKKYYPFLYNYKKTFKLLDRDGKYGYPKNINKEIYDGIHIGAACDYIPFHLLQQLKKNGILVIPLKLHGNSLTFCIIHKDKKGNIHIQDKGNVRYVPLI